MFWSTLLFTAEVTMPVCVMLLSGVALKRWHFIDDHFVSTASRLVFNICMPALLFTSMINLDINNVLDINLVIFAMVASTLAFASGWFLANKVQVKAQDKSAFIQGSARANLAIVGMALAGNLYGDQGIALMSLILAFLVPLYNVISVFVLSYFTKDTGPVRFSVKKFIFDLIRNPLILAIASGSFFALAGWQLPSVVDKVGRYFSQITLPLALISIGGSLSLNALSKTSQSSLWASFHKVFLMPLLMVPFAWLVGFRDMELGILFLTFACPTAAASFVMAKAMGANATLAANIIVVTTLAALPATAIGIFVLRLASLI